MATREVLKNFNLFVDGKGFAGVVEEFVPPVLSVQTEDFRAGGMDASVPIDMGMEKLECSFNLINFDREVIALFGFLPGVPTAMTVRGAIENEFGVVTPVVVVIAGRFKTIDMGTWKPGEKPSMKVSVDITKYVYTQGGIETILVDVPNMVRMIGGVDKMAAVRSALGIAAGN